MPCTCRCVPGFLTTSSALIYQQMQVLDSMRWSSERSVDGGGQLRFCPRTQACQGAGCLVSEVSSRFDGWWGGGFMSK